MNKIEFLTDEHFNLLYDIERISPDCLGNSLYNLEQTKPSINYLIDCLDNPRLNAVKRASIVRYLISLK